jgi:ABC-type uncharacterized transport system involved in gliding motility auxiliary subunit
LDLTENQIFTLAPQSQEVVQTLEAPGRAGDFRRPAQQPGSQLLESYQRQGDQFTYEYVNPYDNPRKAQEFGATQTGSVYLDTGENQQFLQNMSAPKSGCRSG